MYKKMIRSWMEYSVNKEERLCQEMDEEKKGGTG
jgi:hypothetical protein